MFLFISCCFILLCLISFFFLSFFFSFIVLYFSKVLASFSDFLFSWGKPAAALACLCFYQHHSEQVWRILTAWPPDMKGVFWIFVSTSIHLNPPQFILQSITVPLFIRHLSQVVILLTLFSALPLLFYALKFLISFFQVLKSTEGKSSSSRCPNTYPHKAWHDSSFFLMKTSLSTTDSLRTSLT